MSRLLLLDGHSLAYRAFFALPAENFSTSTGQTTNAVYGFTSMLINVLRDEAPTHVGVAFDVSRKTFRLAEYSEYKAGRSVTPDAFQGQISLLQEVLDALRIRYVQVEGFEADDLLATLAKSAIESAGIEEVLICSGDRDTFQLVNDRVSVLYPVKGVSELARMTPAAVEAKYGLAPHLYSDLAALVGESSDNLLGVPGVGPKTAAKWIQQYGDLTGLVAHVNEVKGKVGDALRENLDAVLRNRRLNQLVHDVAMDVTVDDLKRQTWDREEVHKVFDGLEFRVLRDRLFATLEAVAVEAESGFDLQGSVLASERVPAWLADHTAPGLRVGVHVDGAWARGTGDARALAIATETGVAAYIDLASLDPVAESALASWLGDPHRNKAMHDAKGPMQALTAGGLPLAGLTSDTALSAYLVRPDQRSYDLADLVLRNLSLELRNDTESGGQGLLDFSADGEAEANSAMVRARAVLELAESLDSQLEQTGGAALLAQIELPLVNVLASMERVGIAVDEPAMQGLEADFAAQVREAQGDAYNAIGGEQINLGSPKQLQVVLFDKLGMPKTKRTKTGYTTDADALTDLYAKTGNAFLEALLRHRDASRLRQTIQSLLDSGADDGRIHTTYLQTIAATGRLSSTDPNLQNVPIRTEEGRRIRA
ncbi:MAG: polymerase, partial [Actinomycetota bacterium]|nr:polymerase [Actinomycetota bacterium]